jgi:hypothetical protein
LETAQTMLDAGMTVRQIGDALDVPTKALRGWLTAAGVALPEPPAPTGTPAGSAPAAPEKSAAGKPALVCLNEAVQAGRLRAVDWQVEADGPAHALVFTAQVRAEWLREGRWVPVSATATASSKTAARTGAADALTTRTSSAAG